MRFSLVSLSGIVWILLCIGGGGGRAEMIQWSYQWSRSPAEVHADAPGRGYVAFSDGETHSVAGNSYLVATNLQAHSSASNFNPDVFSDRTYTLHLTLRDEASGKSGTISFGGELNGTLTAYSSKITNTFTGNTSQTLVLGDHQYKVSLDSYSPPGPSGDSNSGGITAQVDVSTAEGTVAAIFHTPEPNSATLAILATTCLGIIRRCQRRTRR